MISRMYLPNETNFCLKFCPEFVGVEFELDNQDFFTVTSGPIMHFNASEARSFPIGIKITPIASVYQRCMCVPEAVVSKNMFVCTFLMELFSSKL